MGPETNTQQHFQPSGPNHPPVPHPKPPFPGWRAAGGGAAAGAAPEQSAPCYAPRGITAASLLKTKNKQVCYTFFFFFSPPKVYYFFF